jgi:pimeloyl-ACP methyl ester carboxylesterase
MNQRFWSKGGSSIAGLAALMFVACTHTPPAVTPPPEPVRAYADVNGLHMYYEIHGKGRPILLLHGGIADNSLWSKTITALAKEHQVIAPEQMGHGHTADLPSREFSYAQMAEDTAVLLDQLGLASVDVVGWSDGGIIGYLLAINHPQRVRKLVTSGSNVDQEGVSSPKTGPVKPDQFPKMFQEEYDKVSPDGPQHFVAFINRVVAMWRRYPYVERAKLASIGCPTLIIVGDHDFFSVEAAEHIAKAIQSAQLMVVPGAGHGTFRDKPELVHLAVLEFLDAPLEAKK